MPKVTMPYVIDKVNKNRIRKGDSMKDTLKWIQIAKPDPTPRDFFTQLSVHMEEFKECVESLAEGAGGQLAIQLDNAIDVLRQEHPVELLEQVYEGVNRKLLADSLADQYVTLVATAHTAGIDIQRVVTEVEASNLSKYEYMGISDVSDLEWVTFDKHCRDIEAQGRYKGVYWKRVDDYIVWYEESGKVLKGPRYFEPNLEGMY